MTEPHPGEAGNDDEERDGLGEAKGGASHGIERVREAGWLPYSFLRRAGLSVS